MPPQSDEQREFEALMPEPAAFRARYRSEPGMIGHYPWTYSDPRRRLFDRPKCEYEDLYTADQMREAIRAATERAAKAELEACENIAISWSDKSFEAEQIADEIRERAAAIRNGGAG